MKKKNALVTSKEEVWYCLNGRKILNRLFRRLEIFPQIDKIYLRNFDEFREVKRHVPNIVDIARNDSPNWTIFTDAEGEPVARRKK